MQHVSRDKNTLANNLAQQASGFQSNRGKFSVLEKLDVPVCQIRQSSFRPMHNATVCSAEPCSAIWMFQFLKPEGPRFPGCRTKQAK
jgi:hypothetical protein